MTTFDRRQALLALLSTISASLPTWAADKPPTKSAVKVRIAKETTYITEPLRPDGWVDYVAAINQRLSKGVTPDNNAAVLLLKAFGPTAYEAPAQGQYYQLLGIHPLPEKGNYFIPLSDFVIRAKNNDIQPGNASDRIANDSEASRQRPWSDKEYPEIAQWLSANEKPLVQIADASKCPRRFDPLIAGDDGSILSGKWMSPMSQYRELTRALVSRAMLRAHQGDVSAAWDDLLACHRLARLYGQGPCLVDALVAIACDAEACRGDQRLLSHCRIDAAQLAKMRRDLDNMPSVVDMAATFEFGERLFSLDSDCQTAREGLPLIKKFATYPLAPEFPQESFDLIRDVEIDWNEPLRMDNAHFDRIAAALRQPNREVQRKQLAEIDADLRKSEKELKDSKALAASLQQNPVQAASRWVGQELLSLLTTETKAAAAAEDRGTMTFDLTRLAFALAEYRADRGTYPEKLTQLAPKYAAQIPQDIFADSPLRYERKGDGYVLYSVGMNGKDNGGKAFEDDDENLSHGWDDLVVRMGDAATTAPPSK